MAKNLDKNYKIGLDIDGDGKPDVGVSLKTIGENVESTPYGYLID